MIFSSKKKTPEPPKIDLYPIVDAIAGVERQLNLLRVSLDELLDIMRKENDAKVAYLQSQTELTRVELTEAMKRSQLKPSPYDERF